MVLEPKNYYKTNDGSILYVHNKSVNPELGFLCEIYTYKNDSYVHNHKLGYWNSDGTYSHYNDSLDWCVTENLGETYEESN